ARSGDRGGAGRPEADSRAAGRRVAAAHVPQGPTGAMKRRGAARGAAPAQRRLRGRTPAAVDAQRAWSSNGSRVERIDRVLVDELAPSVLVRGPGAHHLRDVLRVRPGDAVEAFDGRGYQARGVVAEVGHDGVSLTLEAAQATTSEPPLRLTLAVALLKGDKLTDVIRPATEIGV